MVEILKRQKFSDAIPAGLPAGTPVAHKTGTSPGFIMTPGLFTGRAPTWSSCSFAESEIRKKSAALMAELSKAIFDANAR